MFSADTPSVNFLGHIIKLAFRIALRDYAGFRSFAESCFRIATLGQSDADSACDDK